MRSRSVRMIADIATPSGVMCGGMVYEIPDELAEALVYMGWAEDVPQLGFAVQTPEEHATALRQRRGGSWH